MPSIDDTTASNTVQQWDPSSTVPNPRRWWALAATSIGLFMAMLDVNVVVVALPTIGTDLKASFADLQWTLNEYALALAVLFVTVVRLGGQHLHWRYRAHSPADRRAGPPGPRRLHHAAALTRHHIHDFPRSAAWRGHRHLQRRDGTGDGDRTARGRRSRGERLVPTWWDPRVFICASRV